MDVKEVRYLQYRWLSQIKQFLNVKMITLSKYTNKTLEILVKMVFMYYKYAACNQETLMFSLWYFVYWFLL